MDKAVKNNLKQAFKKIDRQLGLVIITTKRSEQAFHRLKQVNSFSSSVNPSSLIQNT